MLRACVQKSHWKAHRPDCSDERRWQVAQQSSVHYNPMAMPGNPVGGMRPSAASTAVPSYGMSRPVMRAVRVLSRRRLIDGSPWWLLVAVALLVISCC